LTAKTSEVVPDPKSEERQEPGLKGGDQMIIQEDYFKNIVVTLWLLKRGKKNRLGRGESCKRH
jgi:hypothetical protein